MLTATAPEPVRPPPRPPSRRRSPRPSRPEHAARGLTARTRSPAADHHEDRDRRSRGLGPGRRIPAGPRARGDGVRGRRLRRRPHEHGPGRHRRTRPTRSTPGSSSSTTATTRTSSGCWTGWASPAQPSTMSFSVSDGRGDFEYNGSSPNGLFAKRAHLVTPWFHRMIADLARFNRAARELLRGDGERPVARPLARAAALLAAVHRPADRPPGLGRVVGRPAPDVDASRRASWPSSSTTTGCSAFRGPAPVAHGPRRLGALRGGAAGAGSTGAILLDTPVTRVTARRRPRAGHAARRRAASGSTRS